MDFQGILISLKVGKKYDFKQSLSMDFTEIDDYKIYLYNTKVQSIYQKERR